MKRRPNKLSFLAISPLIASALCVGACSKTSRVEAEPAKAAQAPTVAVAKASVEDLSRGMVLTAEFKPYQEVDVMAKVAGYVKKINVDVGDRVKEGQLLATLEIPEMVDDQARAKAALDRAQAEVARAKDQVQQAESSHQMAHLAFTRLSEVSKQKTGLVAQQEIDDAHGKDLVGESQIAAAKSNLSAAQEQVQVNAADLQKVKTLIDYTRVTAPFDGVVTRRYADNGSMIQAGTASSSQAMPVVRVSQNSLLRLILPVPESAVPTVHIGQPVDVRVKTLNRSFPGHVARFSGKVSLSTRTMDTEVDVPNPSLVLIPGMYAEVDLTLEGRGHVIAVPVPAVDTGSDEASGRVFVVTADNHVDVRKVALGLQTADFVQVVSGVKDGEMVVVGNRAGLQPGQAVVPKMTVMAAAAQ